MKILVTGGCGFIGSNFIRHVIQNHPDVSVVNLDALTYAGNLENLSDIEGSKQYKFVRGSIADSHNVGMLVTTECFDTIVNFAAESHVDRSLYGPEEFVRTNVQGTAVLLEAAKRAEIRRFLQVSTDEVYGSLPPSGVFTETTPLHPNNPYSATKAAADHMAMAYAHTFGMDIVITRSSNNYGPYQYPEKFIPLMVTNAMEKKECPIYGDGKYIRDWLHVEDNCRGIFTVLEKGVAGEVYNLGGGNERLNIDVAKDIMRILGTHDLLLRPVPDRPGHDRRYAIDSSKARKLGWEPRIRFENGLVSTVRWYQSNEGWISRVKSGEYKAYYEKHYGSVDSKVKS